MSSVEFSNACRCVVGWLPQNQCDTARASHLAEVNDKIRELEEAKNGARASSGACGVPHLHWATCSGLTAHTLAAPAPRSWLCVHRGAQAS